MHVKQFHQKPLSISIRQEVRSLEPHGMRKLKFEESSNQNKDDEFHSVSATAAKVKVGKFGARRMFTCVSGAAELRSESQ